MKKMNDEEAGVKGYIAQNGVWNGAALARQPDINYGQDSASQHLFGEYLAKAYSEKIKMIFVYAPMYIGVTKKIKDMKGMYQMYDSFARKYNIPILDYNYDSLSYDTTYFYNGTHLNKTGAELFSIKLAHAIDSLERK
jgi:hypothetical protein